MYALILTVFVDTVGFGIVLPLLPLYAQEFGASPELVTLVAVSFTMGQAMFGPFWGWLNAYNSLLSNVFDLAAYPSLFGTYVATFLRLDAGVSLSSWGGYGVSLAALALIVVLNVRGMRAVGAASAALALCTVLPFAVQPAVLAYRGGLFTREVAGNLVKTAADWGGPGSKIDWNTFTSARHDSAEDVCRLKARRCTAMTWIFIL